MLSVWCLMKNYKLLFFPLSVLFLSFCSMADMPKANDAFLLLSFDQVEIYRVVVGDKIAPPRCRAE